jgi:neogenin
MVDSMQYHVTDLREFTDYTFWVSALNANGEGALSEEITCMTFSDIPADPPQNVTLEAASSTSIIVRWEPPPKESQNGIITGYKIRWRSKGKGKSEIVTTDGSRRLYAITGLQNDEDYQMKLAAMTVNGTGPATQWLNLRTLVSDLDESIVPDPPSSLKAKATDIDITIYWKPPRGNKIKVRGYTVGWGKGIPDAYTQVVDEKQRSFVIPNLKATSEYVISLRAYNNIGDGRPIYETVRTHEKSEDLEPAIAFIPPVGLHAIVLSSSTVVLTWMDSSLPRNQVIPDSRYYIVRYNPVNDDLDARYSYRNSTDLNVMIDDLRPAQEYEFVVKIVRGRRQSPYSLVVTNRTREAAPASAPRDIVIRQSGSPNSLHLSWRAPKFTNGHINGYVIQYTTDRRADERDWFVEAVVGDGTRATIRNLLPDTKYYFKMSARNNKGYGPPGQIVPYTTAPGLLVSNFNTARTNMIGGTDLPNKSNNDEVSPVVLYAVFGVGAGIILVLVIGAVVLIRYKCQTTIQLSNEPRSNKTYHHAEAATTGTREKLNPPPPDLWIGHDQLELQDISDEAGSAICDETGDTSLARSTPDYRSTMERTRNYIHNGPYSGKWSTFAYWLAFTQQTQHVHIPNNKQNFAFSTTFF